jgi:MarR family transcriptional regulator, organic hydroperoxide resistance regulator
MLSRLKVSRPIIRGQDPAATKVCSLSNVMNMDDEAPLSGMTGPDAPTKQPPEVRLFADSSLNQLLASLARAHRGLAGMLLRTVGLFPGQELLLMQLWNKDQRPQSELVRNLRLEASTVTKMLQRLEAQGLVRRHRPADNQRIIIVTLTDQGRGLRHEVENLWRELEELTTAGMNSAEFQQTLQVLGTLERRLVRAQAARAGR